MFSRRSLSILTICAAVTFSASCGGSDTAGQPAATATPGDAATTTVQPAASADTSEVTDSSAPDTAPAAAPPATDAAVSSSDFDDLRTCMTGNWIMIAEEVEDLFSDTELASVPGLAVTVDGEGLLVLDGSGTFTYTPGYTATISMLDITSTGAWSGSTAGTWALDGNGLTMAPTSNDISGTMTIMGNTSPLPTIGVFDGVGRVVDCNPATMEIELDTPVGTVSHTLLAG